jgi:hypothetical protein
MIVEMTIKRDEAAPVGAMILREQEAILESRRHLLRELERFQPCNP